MWKRQSREKRRKGFTLMETLGAVGILAVLLAIAIPSLISIQKSLAFKRVNEYAKEVFLAAQSNLTELRSTGGLSALQADDSGALPAGAAAVPGSGNALFPAADWSSEYCYTTGGAAFDRVLPAGSIDATLRDKNLLIEYNPVTGNVYAVFYSEEGTALSYDNVYRDEASRRELMLGYYAGSGLSSAAAERNATTPVVAADVNGQEAIVKISVPVPTAYINRPQAFLEGLEISATVTGEISLGSFDIPAQVLKSTRRLVSGNMVEVQFCLDSLADQKSFASLAQNNKSGTSARTLAGITGTDSFYILPGDNLTITAHFKFNNPEGGVAESFDDVAVSGVNSLFGSLETVTSDGSTRYNLYLSNGRHLQNLNAIAPQIAEKVANVYFAADIYWNETADYYTAKYGAGRTYQSSAAEAPARSLPYFVPISSKALFGEAHFSTADLPVLNDTDDSTVYAAVNGGDYGVYYLNIDAARYNIGKNYYAGSAGFGTDRFTGLFSYMETSISNLRIVNPIVKGVNMLGNSPAAGALVGACGHRAFIYNCSAYIDTSDKYFTRASMSRYGVSGYGAVGGLVGYAKSHNTVSGDLVNNASYLAFSNCFTALPVSGVMKGSTNGMYGYTNGVGGVVGCSMLTNFYNCYASGDVTASGCVASGANGRYCMGVGGFVGTSHGTKYTNCFATGDVAGTGSTQCAGGFLGVMCHDEGFNYTNTETGRTTRITQGSIFSSCYAAGSVTANGVHKENFNGYNAPIGVSGSSYPRYPNYYDFCSYNGYAPTAEWSYLFKDSYFLNLYHLTEQTYSNSCSQVVSYDALADLPAYQALLAQNGGRWGAQFLRGFGSADWEAATAATTHSYAMGAGSAYPFTKLKDLDYYGDWPGYPLGTGLAYYEQYGDGSEGFYFDRDGTSTLRNDKTVVTDGYAVLSQSRTTLSVTVGGVTAQLTAGRTDTVTLDNVVYYVYRLPYALLDAGSAEEFYTQLTAGVGGQTYTMYFNPRFALTQVNPPIVEQEQQAAAVKPEALPASISIRTARQFSALSHAPAFWGNGYRYQQELNLSADTYSKNYFDGTLLDLTAQPVGNAATPFNGVYSGAGGYVERPSIQGFAPSSDGAGSFGLFGVIGEQGAVRSLTLHYAQRCEVRTPDGVQNAGLLAGTSAGTLADITLTFDSDAVLAAQQGAALPASAGLLAGANTGTVTGCTLTAAGDVSVAAQNAGGLLGVSAGSRSTIGGCTVTLGGDFAGASGAQYTGAFAGSITDGVFAGPEDGAVLTVGGTVSGSKAVGGFAGLLGGTVSNTNVSLAGGVVSTGTAAGLAGEVRSARVTDSGVTLRGGAVEGAKGAAGVFGACYSLRATNVTAQLYAPVRSAEGDAAGYALSAGNSLCVSSLCRVYLTAGGGVQAPAGRAAGFSAAAAGSAENCSVYFSGGAQITGKTAAGFAGAQEGTLSGCSVSGEGAIVAQGDAAGFVNDAQGVVSDCIATPVRTDTASSLAAAYRAGANDRLTVRGARAAGFVSGTGGHTVLSGCAALGTAEGTQSTAGFASSNGGTIAACTANTNLGAGGAGFIVSNESIVRNCYAWYAPSGTAQVASGFAGANSGSVTGAYAAPVRLGADAASLFGPAQGTYVHCYGATGADSAGASGIDGITHVTFEALACVDIFSLDASGSDWADANTNALYPYTTTDTFYPYPMLSRLPQYGDWQGAPVYSYGVAYYEKAADGSFTWLVKDLSDPAQTVAGRSLSFDNIATADTAENVAETGYAVFYHNAAQLRSIQLGEAALCADIAQLTALPIPTGVQDAGGTALDYSGYTFKIISSSRAQGEEGWRAEADNAAAAGAAAPDIQVTGVAGGTAVITPYFARAVDAAGAYEVRTPGQLQNLPARPAAAYVLTHSIDLAGVAFRTLGTAEAPFKGQVNGNGFVISNYTRAQTDGDTSLFGTLQGAALTDVALESAQITVTKAAVGDTAPVYTVGVLAGSLDADSVLDGCIVRGASVAVAVEDGPNAQLALGALAAGSSGAVRGSSAQALAVTYTPAQAPDGEAGVESAAVVHADIGGLIGRMEGGSVTGSFADGIIARAQPGAGFHTVTRQDSVYRVGGAVGAEAETVDAAKSYTDSYAAVAVDEAFGAAAGKFIGYVYNGAFTACHGWDEETGLAFLGDIYVKEETAAAPVYRSDASYDEPQTVVKDNADGYAGAGFTPVEGDAAYHTYLASLTDCYYSAAGDDTAYSIYQQALEPQEAFYTLAEREVDDVAYTATRVAGTYVYSRLYSQRYSDLIGSNSTTPQRAANGCYYTPTGAEPYYPVYVTRARYSGNRYTYTLYYRNAGTDVRISTDTNKRSSDSVGTALYQQALSVPDLVRDTGYMAVAYNNGAPTALVNNAGAVGGADLTAVYGASSFTFTDSALYANGVWAWTAYYGGYYDAFANGGSYLTLDGTRAGLTTDLYEADAILSADASLSGDEAAYGAGTVFTLRSYYGNYLAYAGGFTSSYYNGDGLQLFTVAQTAQGSHTEGTFTCIARDMACVSQPYDGADIAALAATLDAARGVWTADVRYPVLAANQAAAAQTASARVLTVVQRALLMLLAPEADAAENALLPPPEEIAAESVPSVSSESESASSASSTAADSESPESQDGASSAPLAPADSASAMEPGSGGAAGDTEITASSSVLSGDSALESAVSGTVAGDENS